MRRLIRYSQNTIVIVTEYFTSYSRNIRIWGYKENFISNDYTPWVFYDNDMNRELENVIERRLEMFYFLSRHNVNHVYIVSLITLIICIFNLQENFDNEDQFWQVLSIIDSIRTNIERISVYCPELKFQFKDYTRMKNIDILQNRADHNPEPYSSTTTFYWK